MPDPGDQMHGSMRRSAMLPCVLLALTARVCIAGSYEAERFPSSIVTHHGYDDIVSSPGSQRRRPRQLGKDRHDNKNDDLKIHRSFIDRDPIYFEDEDDSDDDYGHTCVDPFSSLYRERMNQWQSPLESLAPLPSLSLDSNPLVENSIKLAPPLAIHDGPRHSHEIDITKRQHSGQQTVKLKTRSTGTTIAALVANNSKVLILAADTRATDGTTVADKRCEKLHALARNVWCAGAGTSADVDALVRRVKFDFWKRGVLTKEGFGGVGNMGTERSDGSWATDATIASEDRECPSASVPAVLHSIRSQLQRTRGNLGVNLLVGGYDHDSHRAHLAAVHPHGSMDVITYAALGSGGLAATGVLESKYPKVGCEGCSVEEGILLAVDAVRAGIDNDMGSGSQVDVCVIRREGVLYRRAVVREEELEWVSLGGTDGREEASEISAKSANKKLSGTGVNGFGNVPFAIQSKKIVSGGSLEIERERRKWLDGVLGTNDED